MSIRRQMIVLFGLVALLPLIAAGIFMQRINESRLRFDGNARLVGEARRIGTEVDAYFNRRIETARQNGLLPQLARYVTLSAEARAREQTETTQLLLAAIVDDPVNVSSCALLDRDGLNVVDIAPERRGRNEAETPWFVEPIKTGLPFAAVHAPAGEAPAIWVSAPLRDSHGAIHGVLRLRYELSVLKQIISQAPEISEARSVGAVFDKSGAALAFSEGFRSGPPPRLERSSLGRKGESEGFAAFSTGWSAASLAAGERDRGGAVALKQAPWWFAIAEPESKFNAPAADLTRSILTFAALATALVIIAVLLMARRLSRPIAELAAVARRGADGDLAAFATEGLAGEVGTLARDFNQMTARLRGTLAELEGKISAVQASETQFRGLIESSPVGIAVTNNRLEVLQLNRKFTELFGYNTTDVPTIEAWWPLAYPDLEYRETVQRTWQTRIEKANSTGTEFEPMEAEVACRDGTRRTIEFRWTTAGEDRSLTVFTDLTGHREAEHALRASEERFRLLHEHAPDAVIIYDADGGLMVDCNAAAERLFKRSRADLLNRQRPPLSPPAQPDGRASAAASAEFVAAALAGERPVYTWTYRDGDGRPLVCEVRLLRFPDASGRRLVRGSIVDISARVEADAARHRLEQQLWQAQKLDAVGTLAGGIAHDFNNILVGVLGNLQLALVRLPTDDPSHRILADALQASLRARDLVARMLTVSRRQAIELRPTLLEPIVREALNLVRSSVPSSIAIEASYDPGLPPVNCDATQIHQIVINLATNSAYAMRNGAGRLTVELRAAQITAAMQAQHPQLSPSHSVCLSVRDTGTGMDAATLARIFEPFFTTKTVGEGTGLGLAVVHGIVQSLEGAIVVESAPGAGTVFRVYLPGTTASPATAPHAAPIAPARPGMRIALVDDEPTVLAVLSRSLRIMGYVATTFHTGEQLLAALRENPSQFEAVITDLTMPATDGIALARAITAIRADLPIILASGNTRNLDWKKAQAAGVRSLLEKPFSLESLGTVLHRVLSPGKPG